MQIISGTSNKPLASKVAKLLNTKIADVELSCFPNSELRVWIKDKVEKDVVIIQSFSGHPNRFILEYCLLVDAARRSGAQNITAVIPWMGYCIQDKVFRQGEPLSAKVVAEIIQSTKPNKIITFDLHNDAIPGFFASQVTHLSANPIFLKEFRKIKVLNCIVAPDVGALKETTKTAQELNLPIVVLNKKRDYATGNVEIVNVDGNVKNKNVLITDDFISTGKTLIQTTQYLKNQGAKKIFVAITHHLYVKGVNAKLAQASIDELYISDTIAMPDTEKNNKLNLKIVSVAKEIVKNLE